jgi:diadenosine tetraphosphate (Ap4A) HIT family hydrolase
MPSSSYVTKLQKGVVYDATQKVVSCVFCSIIEGTGPANIEYQDDDFIVFHTIKPASHRHLLVVPKKHIRNGLSLKSRSDAELVRQMLAIGKKALGDADARDATFCFHMPPWNSIDHLHMHCVAATKSVSLSDMNRQWFVNRIKYNTNMWFCWSADFMIDFLMRKPQTSPPPSI